MQDDTQSTGTDAPAVADTVDTQATEANVQVSDGAPEAPQENKETPEVTATDTAEEKLYAGKYKTVEDMEKAYAELNSKFTNTSQEKAELAKILNEAFLAPEPAQQAKELDEYDAPEESNPLNQEIDNLKRVQAVQNFVLLHPEAEASTMQKVLSEDPLVNQIASHEAKLEYAYLRSQNMGQSKAIAEAEKKGAQATQAKIAEKQTAQVESAQAAEKTDANTELYEKATGNYSREDRDAARKAYIRKNLVNL